MSFKIAKPPLSSDPTRWVWKKWFTDLRTNINLITGWTKVGTSITIVPGTSYLVTAASINLTLPSSPLDGDWFCVANGDDGMTGVVIVRAGSELIMGLSENMNLDLTNYYVRLVYNSTNNDWRIA